MQATTCAATARRPGRRCRCGRRRRTAGAGRRCASRGSRRRRGRRPRRPRPARGALVDVPARPSSRRPAGPASSAASRSRPVKSSSEEISGPAHSCTVPMPREAACARAARWASARWAGVTAPSAAARTAWWASPVSGVGVRAAVDHAGDQVQQGRGDDGRVDVDTGEVERAGRRWPRRVRRGSAGGRRASGRRPSRGRAAPGRRGGRRRSRGRGRGRPPGWAAPERSSPVRARPVEVVCTWASVNAGVTRAPSRSTTSSTPSAKASAAPSEPTQATWPRSTTIAVAKGSAGLWTSPRRSRTVEDGVAVLTHGHQSRRLTGAARQPGRPRGRAGAARSQTRGGRASYGVDSTTVVRVETPARERSRASSSSSSCGVETRTLRM